MCIPPSTFRSILRHARARRKAERAETQNRSMYSKYTGPVPNFVRFKLWLVLPQQPNNIFQREFFLRMAICLERSFPVCLQTWRLVGVSGGCMFKKNEWKIAFQTSSVFWSRKNEKQNHFFSLTHTRYIHTSLWPSHTHTQTYKAHILVGTCDLSVLSIWVSLYWLHPQ